MPGFDPIGYDDWFPGQPNNDGGEQDCMQLYGNYHYHWDDNECEKTNPFICEKSSVLYYCCFTVKFEDNANVKKFLEILYTYN